MVKPLFEFPYVSLPASRKIYVDARLAAGSICFFPSFFYFIFIIFLMVTGLLHLFIKLFESATRSGFSITDELKQSTISTKNSSRVDRVEESKDTF